MFDKLATALVLIAVVSACTAPDAEPFGKPGRPRSKKPELSSITAPPAPSAAASAVPKPSAESQPAPIATDPKACLHTAADACHECCDDANQDGKTTLDDAKEAYVACMCATECEAECAGSPTCDGRPGLPLLDLCALCLQRTRDDSGCEAALARAETDPAVVALNACYAGSSCAEK